MNKKQRDIVSKTKWKRKSGNKKCCEKKMKNAFHGDNNRLDMTKWKKISEFENTSIKTSQIEKQRGVTEKGGEKYQALWEIYESVNK